MESKNQQAPKETPKKPVHGTKPTRKNTKVNKETKTKVSALQSDLASVKKTPEYLEFITFMAIPDVLRDETLGVRTQEEFAEKFSVAQSTISNWKKVAGFWEDVITVRRDFFKARSANVLLALETKNLDPDKVQGNDVRVLLTYTGEYTERNENTHRIHPDLQEALDKIGKIL